MTLGIQKDQKQMLASLVLERLLLRMIAAGNRDSREKEWVRPGLDLRQIKGCQANLS